MYDAKHSKEEDTGKKDHAAPKESLRKHEVSAAVAKRYIPKGTSIKNGNLRWGILPNNVGYLQMNQMMGMADYEISDTLSYGDYWNAYFEKAEESENKMDEMEGLATSLDSIMKDLVDTNALIIDVRFNGGGMDEIGMAVLERLNKTKKIVFTKKGKLGDGFTPVNQVVQEASENPYSLPTYLLIGPESASATEIMVLSSLSMPNIIRIGSRTEGVFSDILDKTLPNGWEFGLSNEVYLDLKGNNYESVGIPPDIEIGYPRDTQEFLQRIVEGLESEGDGAIEKVLELITK